MLRTQDLGLKEWHLDGKFAAELLLQSRNSLKIVAVPALFLRVPAKPERLEGVLVLEGLSIDAETGEGKVEDHRDWFGPTPWVLSLGTVLDIKFWFIFLNKLVEFASHLEIIGFTLPENLTAEVLLPVLLDSLVPD